MPTLDGMGAVGEGAHAAHESIVLKELAPRTALLAAMLCEAGRVRDMLRLVEYGLLAVSLLTVVGTDPGCSPRGPEPSRNAEAEKGQTGKG